MTIKNRSSRRQKRVPQWFSDHVMENTSQKMNDNGVQEVTEEIRAKLDGCGDGIGENDLELNKRVFGNYDKGLSELNDSEMNMGVRNDDTEPIISTPVVNESPECDNNVHKHISDSGKKLIDESDTNKPSQRNESYVNMVRKDEINKNLNYMPTVTNDTGTKMSKHSKLPIWVRLSDVPLESWSVDGISALASSLGKPLIMDTTTAAMCHNGMGRLDYARVLVEMVADKEFKKVIEVQYRDGENKVKGTKRVNVSYDWKPNVCTHCKVFGHEFKGCTKRPRTPEEEEDMKRKEEALSKLKNDNMDTSGEQDRLKKASFRQYNYKGNGNQNDTRAGKNNEGVFGNNFRYKRQEYRRKQTDNKGKESDGTNDKKEGNKKQWPLKQNEFKAMKKTANKFSILQSLPDDNPVEINTLKDRMIVDQFLNRKIQPSVLEISNWSNDMIKCFKEKWEEDRKRDADNDMQKNESMESDEEDVITEVNGMKENVIANEIPGMDLYMHRRASSTLPWAIMGDMNVTIKVEEYSNRGSSITEDMQDFIDYVNQVEVDDIGSYVVFQPFLVSDHSPAILVIPHNCPKKPKSFKFANYTTDKPEFLNEVINGWKFPVEGHKMDLTVRVEQLRIKLIKAQAQVEKDPYNMDIKSKAVLILDEYNEDMQDEEKLLAQKAKVDWLTKGDKNSSFFHKVIKGRRSRNRVATIYNEEGNYFEGDDVPKQFVNHFQKFLGMPFICSDIVMTDDLFCNVLTPKEAVWMVRNVTNDEVKDAMIRDAIKEFFISGQMLREWNATLISFVPKIDTPNKVSDFRPIACCNSAFIPKRLIQYNILLSQEILRGYGKRNGAKRCAMKIDLQKAYDTISWNFLEFILGKFSFHDKMVSWIMKCVKTAGFSICINGESGFKYHQGCKEMKLINLCFVDDLMIFCHGDSHSASIIKDALKEFSDTSGLFPNLNKSTIYFGSLTHAEKEKIKILESTSAYWASVFKLPKTVIKEINEILKIFLRSNGDSAKGKAKIAWKQVCKPKEYEGLGLKNLETWNEALLTKHLWNIAAKKDTLWVKWVHMMRLKKSIWNVQFGPSDSWSWKCLLEIRDKVMDRMQYAIGDGSKICMWYDRWNDSGLLINLVTHIDLYDARMPMMIKLADMIHDN
ncbi:RNA-directed DNA polymerase, eukaryota, reverse transcriptase zinc-binding domain protein, partial [Tanacetum coccineum]